MLISLSSHGELSVELEPPSNPRRSMFVVIGDGSTILLSRDEAMNLYMQLGAALDEIDRDEQRAAEQRDQDVIDSMPLFEVTGA